MSQVSVHPTPLPNTLKWLCIYYLKYWFLIFHFKVFDSYLTVSSQLLAICTFN